MNDMQDPNAESGKSNLVNFTGRRHEPTVLDREQLVEFIEIHLALARKGLVNGCGIIVTDPSGTVFVDFMVLAGGNTHFLISGAQLLVKEIIASCFPPGEGE